MKNNKSHKQQCNLPCGAFKDVVMDKQILTGLLIKCRDKFSDYVRYHEARGSIDKAKANQEYVNVIDIVLNDREDKKDD